MKRHLLDLTEASRSREIQREILDGKSVDVCVRYPPNRVRRHLMPQDSYPPAVALTYSAEPCIYRYIQDIGFLYYSIVHAYYMGRSDVYVLSIHNSV